MRPAASEGRTLVDASNAFVAISEHITPAVVSVQAERVSRPSARGRMQVPPGFEEFFRQFDGQQPQPRTQESSGSGFIVSKDGYILTNNHVVEDADRLRVAMQDRRIFDARVVGRDPTTDVAVLKIDATDLTTVTFGDDEQLRIGEWVLAVGNPLGLDFTVTAGIVSAKGRGLQGLQRTQYDISDFIQTDAAINPGNSGGPLVNARGEVVGINSAIASQTGFYSGYGFAIPITLAKQVMDDLIAHGEVRRAVIGVSISEVTPEDAAVAGLEEIAGVKVGGYSGRIPRPARRHRARRHPGEGRWQAGRPGERAPAGDPGPQARRRRRGRGDALRLAEDLPGAARRGAAEAAAVASAEPAPAAAVPTSNARLGISVEPVTAELSKLARIPEQYRGVRVSQVEGGRPRGGSRSGTS